MNERSVLIILCTKSAVFFFRLFAKGITDGSMKDLAEAIKINTTL